MPFGLSSVPPKTEGMQMRRANGFKVPSVKLNFVPHSGSPCPFQKPPGMTQLIDASLISILPARFTNFRGNPSWEKRKNVLYLHDAVPERHFFSAFLSRGHLVICPRLLHFPRENLKNHTNKTSFCARGEKLFEMNKGLYSAEAIFFLDLHS